jgi:hypothetical protein
VKACSGSLKVCIETEDLGELWELSCFGLKA